MKKIIELNNGYMIVHYSNKPIELKWAKPGWNTEKEIYFRFQNNRYYLSEFMPSERLFSELDKVVEHKIHGFMNHSFSSGVAISWEEDNVYAYYWYTTSIKPE